MFTKMFTTIQIPNHMESLVVLTKIDLNEIKKTNY